MLLVGVAYLLLAMRISVRIFAGGSTQQMHAFLEISLPWMSFRLDSMLYPLQQLFSKHGKRKGKYRKRAMRFRRVLRCLRTAVRMDREACLYIRMQLGLGDASKTAILCGVFHAAALSMASRGIAKTASRIDIEPVFDRVCFSLAAYCIFSVSLGDIMLAVLLDAVRKTAGGGFGWRNILSKA